MPMDFHRLVEARTVFGLVRWCRHLAPIISNVVTGQHAVLFQGPARKFRRQSDHPWSAVPHQGVPWRDDLLGPSAILDRLDIVRIGHRRAVMMLAGL